MKIEVLFPDFCNLFGDLGNIKYLKQCLPEAEFIETKFDEEPRFVKEDVNLIYMGPTTEAMQEKVIKKLGSYKKRIEELIKKNVTFLMVGNAVEVFIDYIENEDGSKIKGLNIFKDIYAKRYLMDRHNSFFVGKYEDIKLVGFKSQFTLLYGDNSKEYFAEAEKGIGLNKESKLEGLRRNNFIGTYLIGPILVLNPDFTLEFEKMIGVKEPKLAFEDEVRKCYEIRLKELSNK